MNKYLRKILPLCFLLASLPGLAQKKYWITFTDKDTNNYKYEENLSARAIQNRKNLGIPLYQYSDIPLKKMYTDSLSRMGIVFSAKSKWLNSVTAELTPEQLKKLQNISFVADLDPVNTALKVTSVETELDTRSYSLTLEQMKGTIFNQARLSGKGIVIGVIDAGFFEADRDPLLIHLFDEKKIIAQKDFIDPAREDLVETAATLADDHGRKVLTYLCGYYISEKFQSGFGVNGQYYLARTENGDKEHRGEEDDWIMAMEWMDSLGVRLINTSLGYAINMDDPADNYKHEDMNGKTARISKAAQMAVDEKGIFLVVSAGNEGGNKKWGIITAPADAEGVLSVGATNAENSSKIWYSSVGVESLPYLKPNVAAYSPNGTSFSSPAVAGFVACLMEADSTLTNLQIKEIIEKSGHLYPYGNNYIGYGIPQADRALKLLENPNATFKTHELRTEKDRVQLVFKTKEKKGDAVIFHKKDSRNVIRQEVVAVKKRKIVLNRTEGEKATTVNFEDEVIEVIWE